MKLVEQSLLTYRAGASEKVYEIDLCEVGPDRFVVNYRYGRRGKTLKDGTRTVAPVSEADARRIYDKLVSSKTSAGYAPGEAHVAAPPPPAPAPRAAAPAPAPRPAPAGPAPTSSDPRAQVILNRLAGGPASTSSSPQRPSMTDRMRHLAFRRSASRSEPADKTWKLTRVIWRAGQLRLRQAAPLLHRHIGVSTVQDHCVAFALGRCGDPASIPLLRQLTGHPEGHVARMATASLLDLLPEAERQAECAALRTAHPDDIVWRYLAGDDVIDEAKALPLAPPGFVKVRALFKLAEYRCDAQLFGALAHRFATQVAMFQNGAYGTRVPDRSGRRTWMNQRQLQAMLSSRAPTAAYGSKTRWYLRKRTWRTLHRLGTDGSDQYVPMAVGVLAPFTDADARAPSWNVGPYGSYWAFNHILYGGSNRARPHKRGFRSRNHTATQREESFPALWTAQPRALLHLIHESNCTEVHAFAIRVLRAVPDFCRSLPVPALAMMLARPFETTVRFAFELAQSRYVPGGDPAELTELAIVVVSCSVADIRATGHQWMRSTPDWFLARPDGLAALAVSPYADNRAFLRSFLSERGLAPAAKQALAVAIVDRLLALGDEDAERADEPVQTVTDLGLADLPADRVLALLGHPIAALQVLGARLLATQPDEALIAQASTLWDLLTHRDDALRAAVRPTMAGLMARHDAFADQHVQMIIASVLRRKLSEGVPGFLVRFLRDTASDRLQNVPAEVVWRLVRSKEPAAQELGGVLLPAHLDPDTVPIAEVVELGSHEVLALREACWTLYGRMVPRLKTDMLAAVQLLEATWEDSRLFAFRFFEEHFVKDDFGATLLVSICDSVRPDVQAFGRRLITQHFDEADGEQYLLQLSEHPAEGVQLFASNYLERYAAGNHGNLAQLETYFLRVLGAVNRGRSAKQRTHAFLRQEALRDEASAELVGRILSRQAVTDAVEDREACIVTLTAIHRRFPNVELPLTVVQPELRP